MYQHSEKSQQLLERLSDFFDQHIYPNEENYARQLDTAENRFAPLPLMDELKLKAKAAGLWNLFVPPSHAEYCDHGGLSFAEYAPMCELMGRVIWSPEVFNCNAPDTGNMEVFMNYATKAQQEQWLTPLLAGDIRSSYAMTEPQVASSDATNVEMSIVKDGDEWVLNGSKIFITNGIHADLVIVAAITDPGKGAKGTSLFLVDAHAPGFEKSKKIEKIGQHTSDTALLFFTDVRLPADALLGEVNKGFAILMDELPRERLGIAAQAVAASEGALDITIEYVKEREAFGKKVGQFQNTRFKLADVKTQVAVNRAFYEQCANKYATDELTTEEAAMLKLASCEMQCDVADQCLQLFGGYGYTTEYPISRFYVDARIQTIYGGTSEIMRELVARSILGRE